MRTKTVKILLCQNLQFGGESEEAVGSDSRFAATASPLSGTAGQIRVVNQAHLVLLFLHKIILFDVFDFNL